LVLVSGEAGIGKSRLLEEFAARTPEALIARGGCVEGVAYAPWTDALWWLLDSVGPAVVDDLPPGMAARLGRLLPSLALTEPEAGSAADDDGGQHLLFEAVVELLRRVAADRPLVVVVDDLHWVDPASRELLRHVAGNLRRVPILVIAAFRAEDSAPERDLIAHLSRLAVDRIALDRLPEESTAEIATQLLGDGAAAADVARIARDAEGNPLFVEELVAAAGTQGIPDSLRDLMLARFSSLDAEAQHLVRVAAVIGARSPRGWLAAASGLSAEGARTATRAAADAGVLLADDGAYAFRHALLRQAVLDDLLPDELVELHRVIADALTEHPQYAVGVDRTAELARHWDAAEVPEPALKWLVAAAQHAHEAYAFEAAFEAYERALFWWDAVADAEAVAGIDHAALLLDASDSAGFAGHIDRAANLAQEGIDESFAIDLNRGVDAAGRAYSVLWAADRAHSLFSYENTTVLPVLAEVEPLTRARFLLARASHHATSATPAQMTESAEQMMAALAEVADPELEAQARIVNAWCFEGAGEFGRVDAEYEAAAALARACGSHSMLALTLANHASFLVSVPDLTRAAQLLTEMDELVTQYGLQRYAVFAACAKARVATMLGELSAASASLDRIDGLSLRGVDSWHRAISWAGVDAARGAFDAVLNRLAPDAVGESLLKDTELAIQVATLRADALAWQGDVEGCRRAVDEGASHVKQHPDAYWQGWLAMVGLRIEADAAAVGSRSGSLEAIDHAQERAASILHGWRTTIADLVGTSAAVEAEDRAIDAEWARLRDEGTADAAHNAVESFDACAMPYYATYFRWREAEALLSDGKRPAATELLKRARADALAHGLSGLEAAINTLARTNQLRLGPAKTTIDGDDALSVRELEVLRLMVDGRSNPEIAETLYISRRTAAAHVSNIMRKMDASSRVEAVSEAHRRGVV
jgi:DNA-binding CsgD family transcriptional regulator